MMPRLQGIDKKPLTSAILRCTFVGGDQRGGFTGEQLRYPCKLRRHICARCGMHRGEHGRSTAGIIRDEDLPPRKRSAFRRLGVGEFQLLDLGGGEDDDKSEGKAWTPGDVVAKGKRGARRRRAAWCEL